MELRNTVKKQENSLQIKLNNGAQTIPLSHRLRCAVPGCLLLTGFWGLVLRELALPAWTYIVVLPALAVMVAGLMPDRRHGAVPLAALAVLLVGGIVFHRELSESLAGLFDAVGQWHLLRTGVYTAPYENAANPVLVLLLLGAVSGGITAFVLRRKCTLWQMGIVGVLLLAWMLGRFVGGWWLALYLTGTLLTLAASASGTGRSLSASSVIGIITAAVMTAVLMLTGFQPVQTNLADTLHDLRWEKAENPLPEGALQELEAHAPTDEAALSVTMEHWTPLYIRGFAAGDYDGSCWKPLAGSALSGYEDTLYSIQKNDFLPMEQIGTAWATLAEECNNAVTLQPLGACQQQVFLPYAAGSVPQELKVPEALVQEGLSSSGTAYTVPLYDVQKSYLLQSQLEDKAYRRAETAYRQWVYTQYLAVPQQAYNAIAQYFDGAGNLTTTAAKREILQCLSQRLSYQETVLTHCGEKDFLAYVLDTAPQGYSVHYATAATLMLRFCGIPARYVEGYLVTPAQAEALSDGQTLVLTQKNAHAWCEYYLDGVGWLPFDATPGYTDILQYELPEEGIPSLEEKNDVTQQTQSPEEPEETPPVQEEPDRLSQRILVREAIGMLLLVVLLAVLALIGRTVLLRHRLHKRRKLLLAGDCRKACAGLLWDLQQLAKAVSADTKISEALSLEEAPLEDMMLEVWYSDHPITEKQVQTVLEWLESARAVWKQKVPPFKRFYQGFILCKIL